MKIDHARLARRKAREREYAAYNERFAKEMATWPKLKKRDKTRDEFFEHLVSHVPSPTPTSPYWQLADGIKDAVARIELAADGFLADAFPHFPRCYESLADHALEKLDEAIDAIKQHRAKLENTGYGNLHAQLMLAISPLRIFLTEWENPLGPSSQTTNAQWIATFAKPEVVELRKTLADLREKLRALALADDDESDKKRSRCNGGRPRDDRKFEEAKALFAKYDADERGEKVFCEEEGIDIARLKAARALLRSRKNRENKPPVKRR